MTNNKCDFCGGQTGYDFNSNKFTTVVRDHYVIMGNIVCSPCADEIEEKLFYKKTTGRKYKVTKYVRCTPDFISGQHIQHRECGE